MLRYAVTIYAAFVSSAAMSASISEVDPKAIQIATESSQFLSTQSSLSVGWLITYDKVLDGRKKLTEIWAGTSELARGIGYRSRSSLGASSQEYLFDGNSFSAIYGDTEEYSVVPVVGDFSDLVSTLIEKYDLSLPMADVFDPAGSQEAMEQLTEAQYLGEVLFGNEVVHHVSFRRFDGDWQIWISANPDRPVPVMIVGTDPYSQGWPQFQAVFYDWTLNTQIDEDAFQFKAPAGYSETTLLPTSNIEDGGNQ